MLEIDLNKFLNNLLITQEYCHIQMYNLETDDAINGIASVLRSFNPHIQASKPFEFREHIFHWLVDPYDHPEIVTSLFSDQMAHKETYLASLSFFDESYHGDIVISNIDESVLDGASEAESFGLFDQYDIPPVDTWFYLMNADKGKRILFAWIPQVYVHYADKAVAVNCVECIGWFKDWYPREYQQYYLSALK